MSVSKAKRVGLGFVVAFIVGLFAMFAMPATSYADTNYGDVGGINVTIGSGGSLQIDDGNSTGFTTSKGGSASVWGTIFKQYRGIIVGVSGIGAISMIAFFIINFMKLGAAAHNPQARSQALTGVLWTGIAAAGLGAVALITGLFYHALG